MFLKRQTQKTFYNRIFAHGCILLITRPTKVTSKTGSLFDNIFTNLFLTPHGNSKRESLKIDVSDHFPVFASLNFLSKIHKENQRITIHKRVMHGTIDR